MIDITYRDDPMSPIAYFDPSTKRLGDGHTTRKQDFFIVQFVVKFFAVTDESVKNFNDHICPFRGKDDTKQNPYLHAFVQQSTELFSPPTLTESTCAVQSKNLEFNL